MNFWELIRHPRLSRLLAIRWSGQAVDGLFQSALASFVLFSPERQANALSAATAFAVVLLPYSLVGPFVGTILDRVSRQRTIFYSNIFRAINLLVIAALIFSGKTGIELTIFVLVAFGINRLILAGLSAGLPLIVKPENLISSNAIAVTGGSVLVVIGGGTGVGIRALVNSLTGANHADSLLILIAAAGYLSAAFLTLRLKGKEIGPLDHQLEAATFLGGIKEMREGIGFLEEHVDAARGIVATAIQRGGLTALTLTGLLLERNTFHNPLKPEQGLAGFGFALSFAGIGLTLGAFLAPYGVARFGRHIWMRYSLYASSLFPLAVVIQQSQLMLIVTAFFTAFWGQNLKVTNDALVQSKIDDYFRGRVFALYDVIVNGAIVGGAIIAAFMLPKSGISIAVPLLVSAIYFLSAFRLLRTSAFPPR
jgi:hypothetical protein